MTCQDKLASAACGLIYGLLAAATIVLASNGSGVATIWPANAVLLAMLWTLPKRRWAPYLGACFLGSMAANFLFNGVVFGALPFAIANMIEVAVAACLLKQTRDSSEAFGSIDGVLRFILIAGVIAPGASSLIGAATATAIYGGDIGRAIVTWFAADSLGLLLVTPVALMVRDGELAQWYRQLPRRAKSQSAALFLGVAATAVFTFAQSRFPFLFFVFGPAILTSCRLGRVGAALSVMIVATIGTIATIEGIGPIALVHGDDWTKILVFQLFLAVLMMTALPAAAELDKRRLLIGRLAEREAALLLLMDQSSDLLLQFDRDGTCVFASGSTSALAAYTPSILVGANLVDLPHPHDAAKAKANLQRALAEPGIAHRCEYRISDEQDGWFWIEANTRALVDADGAIGGTVSVLRDVSHHKLQEADLRQAATTDPLTGVANRAGFMAAFDRILPDAGEVPCWVGLLDLDRFKSVNDRFGHLAGDAVLKVAADRLRAELRTNDILGRIGGEEFAVVLVGCGEETARQVFERLRDAVARALIPVSEGVSLSVTVSGGFVKLAAERTREEILAAADEALYFSKRTGRNRVTIGMVGGGTDTGSLAA